MKNRNLVITMSLALSFSTTVVASEASFNASEKAIETAQTDFKQVDPTKAKAWENKSASGEDYCKILLNDKDVKSALSDKILILNDRTFLPLRALGDLIGANTYWDETNKVAKIEYKNTAIEMSNNSNKIIVNGSETAEVSKGDPNTAAFISSTNNRMYLPIRAIAENLDGVEIEYFSKADDPIQYIVIRTDGKPITEPTYISEVIRLVNEERAKEGLEPLQTNDEINAAAQIRATELIDLFEHIRPDGSDCFTVLDEAKIDYIRAGENIAEDYSPESVVKGWMNSPSHRANILDKRFKTIGVGYSNHFWSQLFIN